MSESEGGGTRRRRGSSPAAPASLPDDDDLLREIFLRLPPQPSSLPRASAVCKRWRRLVTDPKFHQCFCAHHGKPPVLGYLKYVRKLIFTPMLDPPDRIPPERFSFHSCSNSIRHEHDILGCRHGRVLMKCGRYREVIVYDPISGEKRYVAVPPEFLWYGLNGAVFCSAGDHGHVHGSCHSSPFKVVLVSMSKEDKGRPLACVYSSETGTWGNLISTADPCYLYCCTYPGTFVGNALYWFHMDDGLIEFELDGQSLSMITGPPDTDDFFNCGRQIIQAEDGVVGVVKFCHPNIQIWQRKVNCHGVATWLVLKTVDMHNIFGLPPQLEESERGREDIRGYIEDTDTVFIYVDSNVYMVQLKSMQSKRLHDDPITDGYHPFTSFYAPVLGWPPKATDATGHEG